MAVRVYNVALIIANLYYSLRRGVRYAMFHSSLYREYHDIAVFAYCGATE